MPNDNGTGVLMEQYRATGQQLVERWRQMPGSKIRGYSSERHVDFLQGIDEDREDVRIAVATLLENAHHWLRNMDESTRMLQVGSFEKFVFPIIRAVFANLVANDLVTVQALTAPTGLVFFFDALYGSQKGRINRGDKVYDARTGPAVDHHYSDEVVEEENVATGNGVLNLFTPTLAWTPVRAGTVLITDGTQRVVDDGNGALTGDGAGTINYTTGAVAGLIFTAAPGDGDAITANYEYNSEAHEGVPEIDLLLTSAPVTARPHKLRARWSVEAEQDLKAYHGITAEVELVAFMANEIAKEINYKIVRHLRQVAAAGTVTWSRTPPAGVPWIWHKEAFYDALIQVSNLIFQATQRRNATWMVASTSVCNIVETLSKFKSGGGLPNNTAGVQKIGQIGDFAVYKDPVMTEDEFVMGFKGSSFLDTGYIYAPYQGLYTTPTVVLDDMVSRKGMMQRIGLKVVNANMYALGNITAVPNSTTPTNALSD